VSSDIVERLRSEHRMALAPIHMSDAADEIERLRNRLQACQSNDDSPLTDDCITQNERVLLAENERLRAERESLASEIERLTTEMHRQHDDAIHWLRAYDAERDAIDALHQPIDNPYDSEPNSLCGHCLHQWPCETHCLLHPEGGPS
jgi:hypothetical protein